MQEISRIYKSLWGGQPNQLNPCWNRHWGGYDWLDVLWNKLGAWISMIVKRGEIYYADLSPVVGSEQGGVRPILIIQNDVGNKYSPTVIVAAITSQINKARLPTHVEITAQDFGLPKDSVVLLEQIRTIDKKRLREKVGKFDDDMMKKIDEALKISVGLGDY